MLVANMYLARFVAAGQHGDETHLGVTQRIGLCTYGCNDFVAQPVAANAMSTSLPGVRSKPS